MSEIKPLLCYRCGLAEYHEGWFDGHDRQVLVKCDCVKVGGEPDIVIEWWNTLMEKAKPDQ